MSVREAEYLQAARCNHLVAMSVIILTASVNGAIYFDDQSRRMTIEIGNEAVKNLLAAKMQAVQAIIAQSLPEKPFRRRHPLPHLPR